MLAAIVRIGLALVFVGSALAKTGSPASTRAALGTFGINPEGGRWVTWALLVAAELALAAGVAAGLDAAAYAAAGLMAVFAGALGVAMARGREGAPCACFGSRSRVSDRAIGRSLVLAGAFALVPSLPAGHAQHRPGSRHRAGSRPSCLRRPGCGGAGACP